MTSQNMSESVEVTENAEDPSTLVCRGCLAEWGEMKNMHEWGLDADFFRYTNIPWVSLQGLPVLLCSECEEDLNKTKSFVDRCQESDKIAKRKLNIEKKEKPKVSQCHVSSNLEEDKLIFSITSPDPDDKIMLPCPFLTCTSRFPKKWLLNQHLTKNHKIAANFKIEQHYYCTIVGCAYSYNSVPNKYFSDRKFLNQHFNKLHKDKNYSCAKCKKMFALKSDLYRHLRTCNLIYTCTMCKKEYTSNESYLVHLKRRHPHIHTKYKQEKKAAKHLSDVEKSNPKENAYILNIKKKKLNADNEEIVESVTKIVKERCDSVSGKPVSLKLNRAPPWVKPELGITLPNIQINEHTNETETEIVQDYEQPMDVDAAIIAEETDVGQPNPEESVNEESNVDNIEEESLTEEVVVEDYSGVPLAEKNSVSELGSPCFVEEYAVQECQEDATVCDLKRSSGTQMPECIPNDETLSSWTTKIDFEMQTDGISTQTVLDEILSLKPQNGEDEVFFSGSVSDTQTQTFASEFALNRCNKETQYSMSLTAPDSSFKETQTCVCFCLSSRPNCRHFDCPSSNPGCCSVISAETQTVDSRRLINADVMFSCSSAETQTCFDGGM